MQTKIIEYSDIDVLRKKLDTKKIVLVGGCFDIFHYGHHTFLTAAKKTGDVLIVALESDLFIQTRKKKNPVHTQQQRAELLASTHTVDYVIKLPYFSTDKEYSDLVQSVKPHSIAVTKGDVSLDKKKKQADLIGATVVEVTPIIGSFSSSNIVSYENISSD